MAEPDDLTSFLRASMPLCDTLGVVAEKLEPDEVLLTLDWAPELCTSNGILHGGTVMALADSAGAAVAVLNLPEHSSGTSTIESNTSFLGAVREGQQVVASSRPLHVGSTTVVVETELRAGERLVAKVTQSQIVLH
jgi:uncharacterized protein (TIGR00369 family)